MNTITLNQFNKKSSEWIYKLENPEALKDRLSENTLEQYRISIRKFKEYLNENDIQKINKLTMMKYYDYLKANFKTSTVNVRLIALNKFFKAYNLNPLVQKTVKVNQRTTLDILTEDEVKALYKACKDAGNERLALILDTLTGTGIRIEELKFFTPEAIKKNYITVNNKGKERVIPIPEVVKNELLEYSEKQGIKNDEVIFHGRDKHTLLTKTTIWRGLKEIAVKAGVNPDKVSCHKFRHLYAKRLVKNNIQLDKVANLLGHSSIETTRIYTMDSKDEQLETVNNIFNLYV